MTEQLKISQENEWPIGNLIAISTLFAALLTYSAAAIFIRLCEEEISPNATVFDRLALATLVFGFWKGLQIVRQKISPENPPQQEQNLGRDWWLLLTMSACYLGLQISWAWSISQTTVAMSTLLISLKPIFTCLFAWIILGQQFSKKFLIGVIIAIAGTGIITLGDLQMGAGKIQGDLAALLAAVLEAAYLLTLEKLRTKLDSIAIVFWCCGLGTLASFPIFLLTEERVFPISIKGWIFVISLTIVCQILGQVFLAYSLKQFSSGFISLLLLLEPILVASAGWAIFGEQLDLLDWIALLIILLGLYITLINQPVKTTADKF
ncbi:MAG: DMT family transporter [Cyanobacteria bacterium SBLK]|nr:DMT family transporter [Cyanobacteria bacterium SBLK]